MKKVILAVFMMISINHVAQSQERLTSFKQPVENAIRHSKAIKNAELANQKVSLEQQSVKSMLLPSVSLSGMYGYINSTIDVDLPTQTLPITGADLFQGSQALGLSSQLGVAGITAKQIIFSGLQITNGQKALEQKFKAQEFLNKASYDQVSQEVIMSFDQLMLLKQVDFLIEDSEKRLQREHLKVVQAIANGLAIPYDRDKLKLAILELSSKKAEMASNRELLYFRLQELTGMPLEELESIQFDLNEILLDKSTAMVMNRKELDALESSQKAFEFAYKKEKGAKLPQVFAFGNVSYINAFNGKMNVKDLPMIGDLKLSANHLRMAPNFAVGIGAKWTIFNGKQHSSAIEKAKIDLQINQNKLDDTKEKLSLLQKKTEVDYDLSLQKIQIHQQQVEIAKNNLHLATRQFQEGLSDVTERLEAENEYYKQTLSYYQQILNQRNAALELLKANGNLYQTITQ